MKRIVFWMVALLLMSGVAMAQGNRQGGRQQMDPKTRAERMTERMVKEYSLNEDQKQQLQDVNLAWVQKWMQRRTIKRLLKIHGLGLSNEKSVACRCHGVICCSAVLLEICVRGRFQQVRRVGPMPARAL